MKKIFFLFLFVLAFVACGPQEMKGSHVQEGSTTTTPPVCNNNGVCDAGETVANCPADCQTSPTCNNNGTCDAGETIQNCPADCTPATHITGTLNFSGVAITVDFTTQSVTFKNGNPYRVKLTGLGNGSILEPGETESESTNLTFRQQVYIQAWLGDAAITYPWLHGGDPDVSGDVVLENKAMTVNLIYNLGYTAFAQAGSTVACQFSGRYGEINPETGESDPTLQKENTFYCLNNASASVKVELFHLKLVSSGKYSSDADLTAFVAISSQTGQIKIVDWDYAINDAVAVRTTNLTSSNVVVTGYLINVTLNKPYKMADSTVINIME